MPTLTERFLKYVSFDTQSDHSSDSVPSTAGQLALAWALAEECREMGLSDVVADEFGYVYAALPATTEKSAPTIGFIAHIDTSEDCSGKDVKPRIIKNYDGGDIVLNEKMILRVSEFPKTLEVIGHDLIVTDGTTLLGGDDKAGIAAIMTAAEYLMAHPEIERGAIKIAFTPDEEIARGAGKFDVEGFGADFAYTFDGGEGGEFEAETFNAARANITIKGVSVHPGTAKGIMVNSALYVPEVIAAFPPGETPAATEGREGYYHLCGIEAACGETVMTYIIRDHDKDNFNRRKAFVSAAVDGLNEKRPGMFALEMHDEYYNMKEVIDKRPEITALAKRAIEAAGLAVKDIPIRGGTDGSQLSFMGLPCPNLFMGARNCHGPYEYVSIQDMEKAAEAAVNIAKFAVES